MIFLELGSKPNTLLPIKYTYQTFQREKHIIWMFYNS